MVKEILGSARFCESEGLPFEQWGNGWNLIFGRDVLNNSLWRGAPLKKHFLSVAPTRSGKGVSLIIPNLLTYQGSCIVIDPKGENAWITAEARRKMGQKVYILDPWGEVTRRYGSLVGVEEKTAFFNPLSILDPEDPNYSDDLAYIADSLIINQGKDPHWDNSARELVAGLVSFFVERAFKYEKYKDTATLSIVRLALSGTPEQIASLATAAQKFGPESLAARKLGRFSDPSKEGASIISTALAQTAFLDNSALSKNLKQSSFSFSDLIDGAATVYLVLPVDKLQTYGRWLRLMVSMGIRTVARNTKKLPAPVLFVLDEFGTIGKLSAVSQAVGLMAGLQMCIWAFVQDLVQLKRDYPNEWETFIANAEAVTFSNVMDQFTAEYLSKLLGVTTEQRISQKTADIRAGKDGSLFGIKPDPNYSAMSDQIFQRPLQTPDEIRRFAPDVGIIITSRDPIVFRKALYYDTPFFAERARANPNFPSLTKEQVEAAEKARVEFSKEQAKRWTEKKGGGGKFYERHPYLLASIAGVFVAPFTGIHLLFDANPIFLILLVVAAFNGAVHFYLRRKPKPA